MKKDERYERAKKRVSELKGFYKHLAVYLSIMVLLFFVDYSDAGNWWFYWPAIVWGVFVVAQGISISRFGPAWEDRKIKEIMEEEERR